MLSGWVKAWLTLRDKVTEERGDLTELGENRVTQETLALCVVLLRNSGP